MQRVAQDWLVLEITHSGAALGLSLAAQYVPVLLLGSYGGLLADRLDRRRTLIITQAISGLLAAALGALVLTGRVNFLSVIALCLGLGLVTVVDRPARHAFVVSMVRPADYANAQALVSMIDNAGRLVGPAVAGLLIAGVGVGFAFVVNATSFIAVLISLAALNLGQLDPSPRVPAAKGQIRDGLRFLFGSHQLRTTILLVAVVAIFGQNFRVVLPLAATELYGGDAGTYGWLTSAMGLGALLGAVLSARIEIPTAWTALWTAVAFAIANLMAAFSAVLSVALVVMVAVGAASVIFNTVARSVLLLNSDPTMHGRMMAIHSQLFLGSTPIGGPLVGWLCELWGARAGFVVAGASSLVAAVLLCGWAYQTRDSRSKTR